jgi:acyl-CoA synthetase (AMP-forming)/AMP-acid ligase II
MTITRNHYPTPPQLDQWRRIDAVDTPIDWDKVADIELRLPALLDYCAAHFADRELLVFDDQRITYGAAIAQSALLARQLLGAGIGKGARIGMLFPNSPAFVVVWLAIARIGAVAVPISTLSTAAEIRRTTVHADLQ